jgi:hypothetical protein
MPYFEIRHSVFDIRYSLFQSFFCDQTGRFFGQRRRLYETTLKANRRISNNEYRISKGGIAALDLLKHDRIHYSTLDVGCSMLEVLQFLFRSDWPFFWPRRRSYETSFFNSEPQNVDGRVKSLRAGCGYCK